MNTDQLRVSTLAEPLLQVSKWLKCQLLADIGEMGDLLDKLGDFSIYLTGCVTKKGEGSLSKSEFLNDYACYIEALKRGELPDSSQYRLPFSSVFTASHEAMYVVPLSSEQQLIRACRPVIQLQAHSLDYSHADGKFRSMVLGKDSVVWGIQFSYPQMYQNNAAKQVEAVVDSPAFPNTHLFHLLQRWIRDNTIPTPFLVDGKKINVPMRLGKGCLSWINRHPQLVKKGIQVV